MTIDVYLLIYYCIMFKLLQLNYAFKSFPETKIQTKPMFQYPNIAFKYYFWPFGHMVTWEIKRS